MPRFVQASMSMWIDAALRDEPQLRQTLDQRRANRRALADQHQGLGVLQPLRELVHVLGMIVPDPDVVAGELAVGVEVADGIEQVVEDGDIHGYELRAMGYELDSSSQLTAHSS